MKKTPIVYGFQLYDVFKDLIGVKHLVPKEMCTHTHINTIFFLAFQ